MLYRALIGVALFGAMAFAQGPFDQPGFGPRAGGPSQAAGNLQLRAVSSHTQVVPGETFHVALVAKLADGWVYYSPDPVDKDVAPGSLDVKAGPLRAAGALWPRDHAKQVDYGKGPVTQFVYSGEFTIYATLAAPKDAAAGEVEVKLSPRGQICDKVCILLEGPDELAAAVKVKVGVESAANPEWTKDLAEGVGKSYSVEQLKEMHAKASVAGTAAGGAGGMGAAITAPGAEKLGVWAGIALAILAGLTLNIMPCVLPIIPLRIYSLVQMAGESPRRHVTLGLAFALGIVLFFAGLAVVNVVLKLAGQTALNINEYFGYASVRIGMAMVLLALAANLFGLFEVTLPSKVAGAGSGQRRPGHPAAVGMGFMMAVLSTPCSFWLMALSLAWAQLQPLWLGTLAIVLIGAGMAIPHALLAALPKLLKKLPRPGQWMETFKKTMGFLLLPAVLYLLSTLVEGAGYAFLVAGFGVVLAFGLWMWGGWVKWDDSLRKKAIVRGLAAAIVVVSGLVMLPPPAPPVIHFEAFDAAKLAAARDEGKTVVVKVTAAWCTECKILDATAYRDADVAAAFRNSGVLALKADVTEWTSPTGVWVRQTYGATAAPPIAAVYHGKAEPTFLVGNYDKAKLIEAIRR